MSPGRERGSRNVTPAQRERADDRTPPPARDCNYWETTGRDAAQARAAEAVSRRQDRARADEEG